MAKLRKKRKHRSSNPPQSPTRAAPVSIQPGGLLLDHQERQLFVFTTEMLLNQLRRDGPKIEASFDKLCENNLRELSGFFSTTLGLLFAGLRVATRHDQPLRVACAELLMNACHSFGAAVAILRLGYVLQPGIIIRSILEAVSTVLHLLQNPSDLASYRDGTLQSPKTFAAAKRAIPPLGNLYGYFSDNFAHIGHLHKSATILSEFNERHDALEVNLGFLRIAAWLLYVAVELLFHELLEQSRYWRPAPNGYVYDPSDEEREWMTAFFRMKDA